MVALPVSNLEGLMSTPIILFAPRSRHPMATARPTVPNPQMATLDPDSMFAVFSAAP